MNMGKSIDWFKCIAELQAIAQSGLFFTKSEYEIERYEKIREITARMASICSGVSDVEKIFSLEKGYATPRVDVRIFILKEKKLLLVKERKDGLWTLPGGWIDVGESPSEAAIRETKEETGFDIQIIRLLAIWDKLKHDHPPEWPHAFKFFFLGEIIQGEAKENLEIAAIDFFEINELPPLSLPRVTKKELQRLYVLAEKEQATQFD